jgi:AhpD family alkylhydroperoxidase
MGMMDWKKYLKCLLERIGELRHISPAIVSGYQTIGGAAAKSGLLGAKVNELIALAVAVSLKCDDCIPVHTAAAVRAGASPGELCEASDTAISVNAGAALVYSRRVLDALPRCYSRNPRGIAGLGRAIKSIGNTPVSGKGRPLE